MFTASTTTDRVGLAYSQCYLDSNYQHHQKLDVRDHMLKGIHEINMFSEYEVSIAATTRAPVYSVQYGASPFVGPGVGAFIGAGVGAAGVCWSR